MPEEVNNNIVLRRIFTPQEPFDCILMIKNHKKYKITANDKTIFCSKKKKFIKYLAELQKYWWINWKLLLNKSAKLKN